MVIINIHIPKNGGTTFNDIVKRNFGSRYVDFYSHHETHRHKVGEPLSQDKFIEFIDQCPDNTQWISGHHIRPSNSHYG